MADLEETLVEDEELDLAPETDVEEPDEDSELQDTDDDTDEDQVIAETKPSRGQNRIAALANETKRLKEELEQTRAQFQQAISSPRTPQVSPDELARQEQERLQYMTVEERADYKIAKAENAIRQQMQFQKLQMEDWQDKTGFEAKCSVNPTLASVKDEVERVLASQRAQGTNVPREALAVYLIGQKMLAKANKVAGKKAVAGKQAIRRQTVNAPSGKGSDVAGGRERGGKTARERLDGIVF